MVPAVIEVWRVAAIALLELAAAQLAASVMATVGAQKPIGPSPLKERIEALVFGAVEREECVEADSFLKLHWVACHVNFLFLSLIYMAIFYTKCSLDSSVIRKGNETPKRLKASTENPYHYPGRCQAPS